MHRFDVKSEKTGSLFCMCSSKMAEFCKNIYCPSSQELLGFQRREYFSSGFVDIETHLTVCEFCASEIEFYRNYPQSEEVIAGVEIPRPLLELAEALLSNKHKDFFALNKLLCESESVKI